MNEFRVDAVVDEVVIAICDEEAENEGLARWSNGLELEYPALRLLEMAPVALEGAENKIAMSEELACIGQVRTLKLAGGVLNVEVVVHATMRPYELRDLLRGVSIADGDCIE